MLTVVPISYIFLKYIQVAEIVFILNFIILSIAQLMRLFYVKKYVGLSIAEFIKNVYLRLVICSFLMFTVPYYFSTQIDNIYLRLFLVIVIAFIYGSIIVLFVGLKKEERVFICNYIKKRLKK